MKFNFQGKEINIDKRYIVISCILLFALLLILLLPKNNKLDCVLDSSNSTGDFHRTYTATFEKGKLNTLIFELKNEPSDNYMDMINAIYDNYQNQLTTLKNAGGYDFDLKKGTDYVSYKVTIDLNEIPESTENIINYSKDWNYKDFKKDLESVGYKCN